MPSRLLTLVALLAAFAFAGCGGSRGSDRKDVEQTVETFYKALAAKDSKRACNAISKKGQQEISSAYARQGKKKQSCEEVFNLILAFGGEQFAQAKNVKVTDVKLDGDQAKAAVRIDKRTTEVPLLQEDGRWKLSVLDLSGS